MARNSKWPVRIKWRHYADFTIKFIDFKGNSYDLKKADHKISL